MLFNYFHLPVSQIYGWVACEHLFTSNWSLFLSTKKQYHPCSQDPSFCVSRTWLLGWLTPHSLPCFQQYLWLLWYLINKPSKHHWSILRSKIWEHFVQYSSICISCDWKSSDVQMVRYSFSGSYLAFSIDVLPTLLLCSDRCGNFTSVWRTIDVWLNVLLR